MYQTVSYLSLAFQWLQLYSILSKLAAVVVLFYDHAFYIIQSYTFIPNPLQYPECSIAWMVSVEMEHLILAVLAPCSTQRVTEDHPYYKIQYIINPMHCSSSEMNEILDLRQKGLFFLQEITCIVVSVISRNRDYLQTLELW